MPVSKAVGQLHRWVDARARSKRTGCGLVPALRSQVRERPNCDNTSQPSGSHPTNCESNSAHQGDQKLWTISTIRRRCASTIKMSALYRTANIIRRQVRQTAVQLWRKRRKPPLQLWWQNVISFEIQLQLGGNCTGGRTVTLLQKEILVVHTDGLQIARGKNHSAPSNRRFFADSFPRFVRSGL